MNSETVNNNVGGFDSQRRQQQQQQHRQQRKQLTLGHQVGFALGALVFFSVPYFFSYGSILSSYQYYHVPMAFTTVDGSVSRSATIDLEQQQQQEHLSESNSLATKVAQEVEQQEPLTGEMHIKTARAASDVIYYCDKFSFTTTTQQST